MTAALGVAVTAQSLIGAAPAHAAAPASPKFFDRKAVIARAKTWTSVHVPYSQTDWLKNYRTDCSGFVSMAWGLDRSYVTWSLPEVAVRIDKEDLQPGDIILNLQRHVIIFAGWADKAHTRYVGMEQVGGAYHEALSRVIRYPYDTVTAPDYKPYRYTGGHDKYGHNIFAPGNTLPAAWMQTNAGDGSYSSAGGAGDAVNARIAKVQAQRLAVKKAADARAAAIAKALAVKKAAVKAAAEKAAAAKAAKARAAAEKVAAEKARQARADRAQRRAEAELAKQPMLVKMVRAVVALFVR